MNQEGKGKEKNNATDINRSGIPRRRRGGSVLAGIFLILSALLAVGLAVWLNVRDTPAGPVTEGEHAEKADDGYWVVDLPTPNVSEGRNSVEGIVLHHTATATVDEALIILTSPKSGVSAHVLIDKDGTRYVLADPTAITWHAGKSRFDGKNDCNNFTVGIEFQGNTVDEPLTDDQVESAIDYLLPIISHYRIPLKNIVSHEQIRRDFKEANPKSDVPDKVDVTPEERDRFVKALRKRKMDEFFPS